MFRPVVSDGATRSCTIFGSRPAITGAPETSTMPLQLSEHAPAVIPALPPPQSLHLPEECMSLDIITTSLPPFGEATAPLPPGPNARASVSKMAAIRRTLSSMEPKYQFALRNTSATSSPSGRGGQLPFTRITTLELIPLTPPALPPFSRSKGSVTSARLLAFRLARQHNIGLQQSVVDVLLPAAER